MLQYLGHPTPGGYGSDVNHDFDKTYNSGEFCPDSIGQAALEPLVRAC